ncbi:hypothetical protein Ahy_B08g091075 isoform A [Arachis hypogaea]|uniref:Uncharacterized protein n=1 Tax=Arachis hypogaea TaxID=3818 RepID=A0A444Y1E0_ARAHY|nr:hypothetical protein Ahy_B08g091075 isoform A [Arachis hypogaea]
MHLALCPTPSFRIQISDSNNNELLPASLASTTALCLYCCRPVRRTDPCSLSDSPVAGTLFLPRASVVFVFLPRRLRLLTLLAVSDRRKTLHHSNLLPSSSESRSSTKEKTFLHSNLVAVCLSERLLLPPPLHSRTSVFVLSAFSSSDNTHFGDTGGAEGYFF